ncbi:hypothetical protein CC80DRAFT_53349 [Byssothecium circinans]|uniref:Uncharacterized protein n=1 Tax=Byssothecium circinans TaxID=147558 RepID=A0A6A5TXF5_9PLEO|nr:hypothetical protein CC80DRAFT_53349 [Byssothecium circinans]
MRLIAAFGSAVTLLGAIVNAVVPNPEIPPADKEAAPAYCGFGYSETGLRGNATPLQAYNTPGYVSLSAPVHSVVLANGYTCAFYPDETCKYARGAETLSTFQGDLMLPTKCYVCTPGETPPTAEGSLPLLNTRTVENIGYEDPAANQTAYCGYLYTEYDLRGSQVEIIGDYKGGWSLPMKSAIVSHGYGVRFMNDHNCNPNVGYSLVTEEFRGNFPVDIWCVHCVVLKTVEGVGDLHRRTESDKDRRLGASTPPATDNAEYAGYIYSERNLRGDSRPLDVDTQTTIVGAARSAIISLGYLCLFTSNDHCSTSEGFYVIVAYGQGDFEKDVHCYHCWID